MESIFGFNLGIKLGSHPVSYGNHFAIVFGIVLGITLGLHPMSCGNHFGRTIETTLHVLWKLFRYHCRNHFGNKAGITSHVLRKSLWSHVGKYVQILFRASLGMTLTKFEYPVSTRRRRGGQGQRHGPARDDCLTVGIHTRRG